MSRIKDMKVVKGWWKKISEWIGPGMITGAADDDPSGIATYAQAGAAFGYRTLWVPVFATPPMVAVQEMCARIGIVTRHGLAGTIRRHYSRWLLYPVAVAGSLFRQGVAITTAADAAEALRPVAGDWAGAVFALGIMTLIVMTLAGLGLFFFR